MNNNVHIGNKSTENTDFQFLSNEQLVFVKKLSLSNVVRLPRAGEFDDKEIDTNKDNWQINSGGRLHSFIFFARSNYENLNLFLKLYLSMFIPLYSVKYSYYLLKALKRIIVNNVKLTPETVIVELEQLAISKTNKNIEYYVLKRFYSVLIENEFPEFDTEHLYKLDTIKRPSNTNWAVYYQLDVKLKPYENNMIRQGLFKASLCRKELSKSELIDCCVLALFYATGARPVQAFNLKDTDVKKDANGFYSIALPFAKQTSNKRGKINIKLPTESALLFLELISKRSKTDECQQFLRKQDGTLNSRIDFFIKAINRQIYRFSPTETRRQVDEGKTTLPHHTPYDYRHNLGHQMAMAGASAEEIAAILGHSTLVVARHYIAATPELAFIKKRALGENAAYLEMMGMILTGEIANESRWSEKKVAGDIDNTMFIGIGGCTAPSCQFSPVRSCYSCTDFCPFRDAPHEEVLNSVKQEVRKQIAISDATGQVKRNPTIVEHEQTIFEIESVMARIKMDIKQ